MFGGPYTNNLIIVARLGKRAGKSGGLTIQTTKRAVTSRQGGSDQPRLEVPYSADKGPCK